MQFVSDAILMPAHPANTQGEWLAQLRLEFERTERGTRLMRKTQLGPLYVQRPFYPEGKELAHVYLLHPPGGLVSGDKLEVQLQVGKRAQVLCTTPGAARLYRARADRRWQEQRICLQVSAGSSLEWMPQENIVFEGAHARLLTEVELEAGALFTGWDITVLGMPVMGEALTHGSLLQRLQVSGHGRPLLREQLLLDERTRQLATARIGLHHQPVTGIFVCGPFSAKQMEMMAIADLQALRPTDDRPMLGGISRLGQFLVGRYLGGCAEQARSLFTAYWQWLRPMQLQRPACAPAIWST